MAHIALLEKVTLEVLGLDWRDLDLELEYFTQLLCVYSLVERSFLVVLVLVVEGENRMDKARLDEVAMKV